MIENKSDGITSSVSIMSNGSVVSEKEEDLKNLLSSLKLWFQFPISVLCRDALKDIIALSSKEKYKLFVAVAEVDETNTSFDKLICPKGDFNGIIKLEEQRTRLLEVVKTAEQQEALKQEADNYRAQLDTLEKECVWARVNKYRSIILGGEKHLEELRAQQRDLRKRNVDLTKKEFECSQRSDTIHQLLDNDDVLCGKKIAVLNKKRMTVNELKKELKLVEEELEKVLGEKTSLNNTLKEITDEITSITTDIGKWKELAAQKRAEAEKICPEIKTETSRELVEIESELVKLKESYDAVQAQIIVPTLTLDEKKKCLNDAREELKVVEDKWKELTDEVPNFADMKSSRKKMLESLTHAKGEILSSNFEKVVALMACLVKGYLLIDHENEEITIKKLEMAMKKNSIDTGLLSARSEDVSNYSVKEHKLLAIAFIVAMWMSSNMPVFFVGGLEGFLDCNDKIHLCDLIIQTARKKNEASSKSQVIFIQRNTVPWSSPTKKVNVFKICKQKRAANNSHGSSAPKKEKKDKKEKGAEDSD